ncbi:MAG: hypothetical protein U0797_14330 [Gemmataceae bacterium]
MHQEMTADNVHQLIVERRQALAEVEQLEGLRPGLFAAFGLAGLLAMLASVFGAG